MMDMLSTKVSAHFGSALRCTGERNQSSRALQVN
jgi:hypothetical protein